MGKRSNGALLATIFMAVGLWACDDATGPGEPRELRLEFDFAAGLHGWDAGFADYPEGEENKYQLQAGHDPLPAPLDANRRGYRLSGYNHSDDLLMYIARPVTGLEPGSSHALRYSIEFATRAPSGCSGVGGAPGESVFVKAGAAPAAPDRAVDEGGHYRLTLDVGNQAEGGAHAATLGTVAGPSTDCFNELYALKTVESQEPLVVEADTQGRLWLFVGFDSGFEATTTLYVTRIEARLTPAEPPAES